jgi:hypothetical protein
MVSLNNRLRPGTSAAIDRLGESTQPDGVTGFDSCRVIQSGLTKKLKVDA